MSKSHQLDSRLYCSYKRLVKLQCEIASFSLLPRLSSGSVLSGRHSSLFRGRGLNFEELRHYQTGDDIRNLDWKVTLRTGSPHIRVYSEEKDFNVIVCVDQSSSMFFATLDTMKSVVAAEIAALCGWRVLKDSDRIGYLIFDDNEVKWYKPRRSQKDLLNYLSRLAKANQSISVSAQRNKLSTFSMMVDRLIQMKLRNSVLIVLSDWYKAKDEDLSKLKYLQANNDLLGILISDPLESSMPLNFQDALVVSDGSYQLNIDNYERFKKAHQGLESHYLQKVGDLTHLMAVQNLPFIQLDTSGNHLAQFKQALGGVK